MIHETPWRSGRLGRSRGPARILFGAVYEDPEIEARAFQGKSRIFCIAGAGCTAMRLSRAHDVVACDINPAQLEYARLRLRGAPALPGDAERAMRLARSFSPLVGWRGSVLRDFLSLSDVNEQASFWNTRLDTRRFRTGFDALLSRLALRAV